jgi:hypothetical protein
VVGSVGVVRFGSAAELRPGENGDLGPLGRVQSLEQCFEGTVQVGEKLRMPGNLVAVGVEAPVAGVEDAPAETGVDEVGGHQHLTSEGGPVDARVCGAGGDRSVNGAYVDLGQSVPQWAEPGCLSADRPQRRNYARFTVAAGIAAERRPGPQGKPEGGSGRTAHDWRY